MIDLDSKTVRIVSCNGGGNKGYGSNRVVRKIMQQAGIPQGKLWQYTDVICGTSIGGILGAAYAYGKTCEELDSLFLEKGKRIFTIRTLAEKASASHNANTNSNRPDRYQKVAFLANNEAFYSSPYNDSNFGSNILHQTLVDNFGTSTLADLKTYVVIPAFEKDRSRYVVFSNFNDSSFFLGATESIVNVCRATSAAPIYLPHYTFNEHDYIDGGIYANDPVLAALNLAFTVKPEATRAVIIDIGTGIGSTSFDGSAPLTGSDHAVEVVFKIMNVAMTGAEEWTRYYLDYLSTRLARDVYYYKFQPIFPSDFPNELDNSSDEWFTRLASLVDAHYASESNKIADIIARFMT